MSTSHTPGPWFVVGNGAQYGSVDIAAGTEPDTRTVVSDVHPDNARLISAAPELLAAVQECLRCFESLSTDEILPRDTCPADLVDMLNAAIAKAVQS